MGKLRIALFGGLRVLNDGARVDVKVPRGGQRLLGFLLIKRSHPHTREELTNLFWPEYSEDRARACLNTELWRLRQVLEPHGTLRGTYLRAGSGNTLEFNWSSDHWLDVAVFEEQVGRVISHSIREVDASAIDILRDALQLYAGELLEGIYDDWALFERECMRSLYIDGLAYLMGYCKQRGKHSESANCGQKILDLDPLREEIHRELMRLYMDSGQRPKALMQYETCLKTLETELGIPPMEETRAVYAEIIKSAKSTTQSCSVTADSGTLKQAVWHLKTAVTGFEKGQTALRKAVSLVEVMDDQSPARDD